MAHQKSTVFVAVGTVVAGIVLTSGCGDDYGLTGTGSNDVRAAGGTSADPAPTVAPAVARPAVKPAGRVTGRLEATSVPKMGNVVTDSKGWVLYRFDKDRAEPSKSSCLGDCAKIWPPVLAGETLELSGIPIGEVSTIRRADGGRQITLGGWPVYRYIGDKEPGTWKGQNVARDWFAVQKDGTKNLTCLPEPAPKAAELPASSRSSSSSEEEPPAETYSPEDSSAAPPADNSSADGGGYGY